jgi:probable rRNA maturation factor
MDIQIANRQKRRPVPLTLLRRTARILIDALKRPDAELSVLLVDDRRIARLNREFLDREGPTNVIAFPMQEGRFAELHPTLLGDVVISVDTAAAEAERAGIAFERRLVELLVHGVLHLCGYDHEHERAQARRMAAKSRALLKKIDAGVRF